MESMFRILSVVAGAALVVLAGYRFVVDARLAEGTTTRSRFSTQQLDVSFVVVLVVLVAALAIVMRLGI